MPINKEYLEGQLVRLRQSRDKLVCDIHATDGALQMCEYLLMQVEEPQQLPLSLPTEPPS